MPRRMLDNMGTTFWGSAHLKFERAKTSIIADKRKIASDLLCYQPRWRKIPLTLIICLLDTSEPIHSRPGTSDQRNYVSQVGTIWGTYVNFYLLQRLTFVLNVIVPVCAYCVVCVQGTGSRKCFRSEVSSSQVLVLAEQVHFATCFVVPWQHNNVIITETTAICHYQQMSR